MVEGAVIKAKRWIQVLVHKSAVGRGSTAIAVCQAMRCDTGSPARVIRLSTEQATRASVFWLGRVRARRPRPMMVLYRNTAIGEQDHGLPHRQPAGDHFEQLLLCGKADGALGLRNPPS